MGKLYETNSALPDITPQQEYNINFAAAQAMATLRTQEQWQKREIDLRYQIQKSMNQAAYQRELSAIKIEEASQKAKVRADISLEKGLKQMQLMVLADGRLKFEQQRFGEPLQNILAFRVKSCKRFVPIFGGHPGVLCMIFDVGRSDEKCFSINLDEADSRTINRKFTALGLSLGFTGQKETQLRQLLLEKVLQLAEEIELPEDHGWYCLRGKLQFAFPENLTWKEAEEYAH